MSEKDIHPTLAVLISHAEKECGIISKRDMESGFFHGYCQALTDMAQAFLQAHYDEHNEPPSEELKIKVIAIRSALLSGAGRKWEQDKKKQNT